MKLKNKRNKKRKADIINEVASKPPRERFEKTV